jgi:hypothetical protein
MNASIRPAPVKGSVSQVLLRSIGWLIPLALVVALPVAPALALPLISEVFYDAIGSDDGQSFIEISGTPGESLDGFTLEGVNGSNGAVGPVLVLSGVIGASGLFVVADARSDGTSDVALADLLLNFDLQNGPDSVVLTDGFVAIDALGYGVFGPGEIFAGEGSPAVDPAAGLSLARVFADLDTDDNAMDFIALDVPTPGVASFQSVPEPGTGALAYAGLFALGCLRRSVRRRGRRSIR